MKRPKLICMDEKKLSEYSAKCNGGRVQTIELKVLIFHILQVKLHAKISF
jgi:hypothetical protein